jgi:hypothetical protein
MREPAFFNPPPVFIEIRPDVLKVLRGDRGIELPLERAADGKLTGKCREKLAVELQTFLGRKSWQPRVRAVCGISAHGVSLRRLTLPATAKEEFARVLRLQIEAEFPLSPDDLAWGWRDISNGAAKREILVAAVRKETVEDYATALAAAGLNPEFTVAALARNALCPQPDGSHAVLEIARNYSELVSFENGLPGAVRILPASGGNADAVLKGTNAKIIFVSGIAAAENGIFENLSARVDCRRLETADGDGFSAATLGLKKSVSENAPLLLLSAKPGPSKVSFNFSQPETRLWLKRAAVLLAVLLVWPFAEALLLNPFLAHKLASFKNERQQFVSVVNPELQFLQYLKQNQPPYLDALYVFSKAAPPGLHLDSLAISQHGDISLKAAMQNAQQVMDLRAKLIASGFFSSITVEEQTPAPDHQRVNVRMTAQWKPAAARGALKIGPTAEEIESAKSAGKSATGMAAPAIPMNF